MSETSKMGLLGSKEGNSSSNEGQLSKDESPERYAPYSVDSDSETYDTEALSIMDINDIIGVQSEPVGESTLESEIAALSEIITDSKADSAYKNPPNGGTDTQDASVHPPETRLDEKEIVAAVENNDSSAKIDNDKLSDDSDLIVSDTTVLSNVEKATNETSECTNVAEAQQSQEEELKVSSGSTNRTDVVGMSKSLQLIGEAYTSDDSQDAEFDEMPIDKEPKVVFSCKPLVDRRLSLESKKDDFAALECTKTVDESANVSPTFSTEDASHMTKEESAREAVESLISTNENSTSVIDTDNRELKGSEQEVIRESTGVNESVAQIEPPEQDESMEEPIKVPDQVHTASSVEEDIPENDKKSDEMDENFVSNEDCVETEEPLPSPKVQNSENTESNDIKAFEIEQNTDPLDEKSIDNKTSVIVEEKNNDNETDKNPQPDFVLECQEESNGPALKRETNETSIISSEPQEFESSPAVESTELNDSDPMDISVAESEVKITVDTPAKMEEKMNEEKVSTESVEETMEAMKVSITEENTNVPVAVEDMTAVIPFELSPEAKIDPSTIEGSKMEVDETKTDIPESDMKSDKMDENVVSNEDCVEDEKLTALIPAELEEKSIIEEETHPTSSPETKDSEVIENYSTIINNSNPAEHLHTENDVQKVDGAMAEVVAELEESNDNNEEPQTYSTTSDIPKIEIPEIQPNSPTNIDDSEDKKDPVEELPLAPDLEDIVENEVEEAEKDQTENIKNKMDVIAEPKGSKPEEESEELLPTNAPEATTPAELANEEVLSQQTESQLEEEAVEIEEFETTEEEPIEENDTETEITIPEINENIEDVTEPAAEEPEILEQKSLEEPQEIMEGILETVNSVEDLKTILDVPEEMDEEIAEVFPNPEILPLITEAVEDLETTEAISDIDKTLPIDDLKNPIAAESIDALEGLLDLDLIPTVEASMSVDEPIEGNALNELEDIEPIVKEADLGILLTEPEAEAVNEVDAFLTDAIETLDESEDVMLGVDAESENEAKKMATVIAGSLEDPKEKIEVDKECVQEVLQPKLNNQEAPELDMSFSVIQEDKLEIPNDILVDPLVDIDSGVEASQTNTEISELESAVKFLQESEENVIESPSELSPKMVESEVDDLTEKEDSSTLYTPTPEIPEEVADLAVELESIVTDPIAISEAEIINEAAKLENEKKQLNEEAKVTSTEQLILPVNKKPSEDIRDTLAETQIINEPIQAVSIDKANVELKHTQCMLTTKSVIIPKTSILEERLKEPPKIEIPVVESARICDTPMTPKTSLLIPRDARMQNYQKMLESPKTTAEKSREEMKIVDTSRKDPEKHDLESVGSPRIILKIAKSALADCAEPRSPKSPKIRSATNSPNPEDSPGQKLGKIKLKLSKGGHPSIISNDNVDEAALQWHTEGPCSLSPLGMKIKLSKSGDASIVQSEKFDSTEDRRLESPLGMKIKLSKTGDMSIVQQETKEASKHKLDAILDSPKRTDSPLGMKIKLSKSGDASIIQPDKQEEECRETKSKERTDASQDITKRTESPLGMKIKLFKTGDASILPCDHEEGKDVKGKEKGETLQDNQKRTDSPIGMKIKLSRKGGASLIPSDSTNDTKDKLEIPDAPRRTESPLGMKFKLSKSGDASIIHSEVSDDHKDRHRSASSQISPASIESSSAKDGESIPSTPKRSESSIGMKIKLSKGGDATIVHPERQEENQQEPRRMDSTMKIKLSKTGDASIVQLRPVDADEEREAKAHKSGDSTTTIELMKIKLSKTGHPTIVANDTESAQKLKDSSDDNLAFAQKREQLVNRSEVTIEPIQLVRRSESSADISSKRKDVTLSPIESKKAKLEAKLSQMLPEVTIQPVVPKEQKQANFDQPNSSAISRQQMNVISQEISITQLRPNKPAEREISMSEKLKNMLSQSPSNAPDDCEIIEHHPELIIVNENSNSSQDIMIIDEVPALRIPEPKTPKKRGRPRRNALQFQQPSAQLPQDPLALDDVAQAVNPREPKEYERPKRTCRNQRSYAPPKRGRGRGRGKRKYDKQEMSVGKRARRNQDLPAVEDCTMITLDDESTETRHDSSELYKALRQPLKSSLMAQASSAASGDLEGQVPSLLNSRIMSQLDQDVGAGPAKTNQGRLGPENLKKTELKDSKDAFGAPNRQNWLTPSSKKYLEVNRSDGMSTIHVIDEETRMSAESTSRSQTPARNLAGHAAETIVNEESQGSVLSTATTESEKVKVKNRRMEINFDPDEGPFTVDKIAEYEWPVDRKGETFMIQEQISQYLGVKSFKRKYPDLKRRMVDMEERNFLRENGLVSEAMCDMGLTAICSSEVLDIMCSDFPDQYEEYRKHMREKQIKEHSKKQKELSAAATAEKNRIDLAEMAVQSALSWNVSLNKARKESRRCSLDLQTFTIHVPKKQQKVEEESKVSHYPVALIPGQYTDYYREYTPAELRYYPLNTVLYGPMRPNERKIDSQSEGSQSDSDSDSSSDDSSCSSSEGTQDTEESQSTMDDVDIELSNQKDKSLKCKMCSKHLNKSSKTEVLIQCGTCNGHVHPSCIDLTLDMVPHIQAYAWQCTDCKTCVQCHDPADEDKMLFCDMCDRGYHIYCVGLRRVPQGRWHCQECAICASCGSREAGGVNADRNSVAQWQHEYKKGDKNTRVYVSTLCVPCSKLWRKGRYCPHCSRCHTVPRLDLEENLVHCGACDKYLHLECVESKDLITGRKNYQCDLCIQNRQRIVKSSTSKVIRT